MSVTPPEPVDPVPPAIDFSRLWQAGRVGSVEEFLARYHPGGVGVEGLLDLIQQEVLLREAGGEVPDPGEYRRRFPAHADQVAALFAVHHLLSAAPPAAAADPAAPAVSGYEIGESLGRGGTGEVFRARDEVLGRPVALKVLRKEWREDPSSVGRFWTEARITARLRHPGVPPLYEAGYDDQDRPFIAMKLVEGRTLADLLAERPAPELPRLVQIFEHVCQTVAYAHAQGVLHRDLKPANVMVGAFGEVQVMDWGLAKVMADGPPAAGPAEAAAAAKPEESTAPPDGLTRDGHLIGTPAYAPPEQARGEHDRVGPPSDVFGLGAVLCDILTGRPPFDTAGQARAGDAGPARARLRAADADPELIDLAVRCLAPEPGDRPPDAGAVAAAVDAYQVRLRERLRAAELTEARSAAERKARRRAEVLRLVGVAVLVAAGVGAGTWFRWQAALARDVTAALDEGRAIREEMVRVGGDPARLAGAERAARRAEGLLRGVVGRDDLRGQAAELAAELEADARDPDMVRRLDELRLERGWRFAPSTHAGLDAAHEAAFRDYGVDVTALDPGEAAARLNRRAIRAALVTALDYWGQRCLTVPELQPRGRHLLAVAGAADPDPWRNRLRAVRQGHDAAALRALARDASGADLPVSTLVELADALRLHAPFPVQPEVVALFREACRRDPGDFWANNGLGGVLRASRRYDEAIPYLAVAVARRPDLFATRSDLAQACRAKGDLPAAVRVMRDGLTFTPRSAQVNFFLGEYLEEQGEAREAVRYYEETTRCDPSPYPSAPVHALDRVALLRVARCLAQVGAWDEALAVAGRATPAAPARPSEWVPHALRLQGVGRFDDALEVLRRGHREAGKPAVDAGRLREGEQLADAARRLADPAGGAVTPRDPAEAWRFSRVFYTTRRDHDAVRLAERTPGPGGDRPSDLSPPYDLCHAYSAVRVGSGSEADATERARCRGLALTWLRAALVRNAAEADHADSSRRVAARRTVRLWQQHRDLAPVREPAALAELPAAERAAWAGFWRKVDDLVRHVDAAGSPAGGPPQ